MHRFYLATLNKLKQQNEITVKEEIHHIRNVLHLKPGEIIEVFNGSGDLAQGAILKISANKIDIQLNSFQHTARRSPEIILACAIPKKSKFETIIEKATELGVDQIVPLKTLRTEINFKGEKADKKNQRYEAVALNASKQAKRVWLPVIHPVTEFPKALETLLSNSIGIIPSLTQNAVPLIELLSKLKSPTRISIFIGPEGDFTSEEYVLAHQKCLPASLGNTVLKVETAALCSVSCVSQYFLHP